MWGCSPSPARRRPWDRQTDRRRDTTPTPDCHRASQQRLSLVLSTVPASRGLPGAFQTKTHSDLPVTEVRGAAAGREQDSRRLSCLGSNHHRAPQLTPSHGETTSTGSWQRRVLITATPCRSGGGETCSSASASPFQNSPWLFCRQCRFLWLFCLFATHGDGGSCLLPCPRPAEPNPAWATETQRWGGDTQSMQPPRGRFPGLDTAPWLSAAAGRAGPAASPGLLRLLGCLVSRER